MCHFQCCQANENRKRNAIGKMGNALAQVQREKQSKIKRKEAKAKEAKAKEAKAKAAQTQAKALATTNGSMKVPKYKINNSYWLN